MLIKKLKGDHKTRVVFIYTSPSRWLLFYKNHYNQMGAGSVHKKLFDYT